MNWVRSTGIHTYCKNNVWTSKVLKFLTSSCHSCFCPGDFAILLHSGVSVRKALLLNVGSAMTSFIGLYIALSIATDLAAKQWIAAITAGLFLYVGLADMVSISVYRPERKTELVMYK